MEKVPEYCQKEILIAGVGNILFGDDGFGPEVIEFLKNNYDIPDNVCLADAGTGIRRILFTISLSDIKPKVIVIIDAVDKGKNPGDVFEILLDELPFEKIDDFSIHQVPSSNLLKELQDYCHVRVVIKVCQIKEIPEMIQTGLSEPLKRAVPLLAEEIAREFF